jgi:PBP1b-binding outer membrane lipoprotein LpoB
MNRAVLFCLVTLLLFGCASPAPSPIGPVGPAGPVKPSPVKPVEETQFSALADRATQDPGHYATTDDLVRVLNRLREMDKITDQQLKAATDALGTSRRKLTPEDLAAIRGL